METSSYIALSRQGALRREMDIIANNLANMNTTAYKGEKLMFVEHLVKSRGADGLSPVKLAFTRDVAEFIDFSDGPIEMTSNPLDIAIKGDGYLVVETEQGDRYTRNGRLSLDPQGQLVSQHGYPVLSDAGAPFFFGPGDEKIEISNDGTISTNNGELGKIRLVRFENQQELTRDAGGLVSSEAPPLDVEQAEIIQGAVEKSNVQPIIELTRMIDVHRSYDNVRRFIDGEGRRTEKLMEATRTV